MTTPMLPPLMPDVEALVIAWLETEPEVIARDALVSSHLPTTYNGTQEVVRVTRSGGFVNNALPFWKDNVRLDLTTFAPTKADAWDLNAIVRRLWMHNLKWEVAHLGPTVQVMDVTEYVGPQWLDSAAYPPSGRYLIQVGVSIHPIS